MSTASTPATSDRYVDFDEYVEFQLDKTRKSIKTNDLITAIAVAAVAILAGLLTFVVFDHWVIAGGFSVFARWCWFLAFAVTTVGWFAWKIGVPSFRSVNRLFAAKELELADPALRSNLLNWVDLHDAGCKVHPSVMQTIEKQAATGLSKMDVGQAVDHRPLLKASYALLGVVVLFCGYALFSPKKVGSALWRVLPFTQGGAVTRTEIREVTPGDATLLSRGRLEVGVSLSGEIPPTVEMRYTTSDGRIQDESVVLRPESEGLPRFRGVFAGENGNGVLQDFSYRIVAGDAQSRSFRVSVHQPPSASVNQVALHFPEYMKLEDSTNVGGHIDGWEGAVAKISATADKPCQSAVLQFLNDPQSPPTGEEATVHVANGTQLEATWTLNFRSDNTAPKHYRIVCRNEAGEVDPSPTVYNIAIKPDRPPEVVLLHPERDLTAAANAVIPLLVQAGDPDFELGYITLLTEKDGQLLPRKQLSEGRQQRLTIKHDFELTPLNLKAGDEIEFWVEAFDNKQPRRNRKNTPRLKIRIEDPVSKEQAAKDFAENKKERDDRVAEAEREQNRGNEPQPRDGKEDDAESQEREPPDRDEKSAQREKQENKPEDPAQGGTESEPNGSGENAQGNKTAQAKNQNGKGNDGQGEAKSGQKREESPLSSEGTDDDQALEKIAQTLNSDSQRDKNPPNKQAANKKQDDTKPTSQPKEKTGKDDSNTEQPSESQPAESHEEQPREKATEKPGKTKKPQSLPKPGGNNGDEPPKPQPDGEPTSEPSESQESDEKSDSQPQPKSSTPKKDLRDKKPPQPAGKPSDSEGTDSEPKPGDENPSKSVEDSAQKPGPKSDPKKNPKLPQADSDEKTAPNKSESKKSNPNEKDTTKPGQKPEGMPDDGVQKQQNKNDPKPDPDGKSTSKDDKQNTTPNKKDKPGTLGGGGDEKPKDKNVEDDDKQPSDGGDESETDPKSDGDQSSNKKQKSKNDKSSNSKRQPQSDDQDPSDEEMNNSDGSDSSDSENSENDAESSEENSTKKPDKTNKKEKSKSGVNQKSPKEKSTSDKTQKSSEDDSDDSQTDRDSDGSKNMREEDDENSDDPKADGDPKPKSQKKRGNKDPNARKTDLENSEKPEKSTNPNPKTQQKTEGDPNATDEELKQKDEPKGRKSQQTDGGKPGGSKQDKEGAPGSQTEGPGEKTNQPGKENASKEKTGKSDPQQRPGQGSESKDGGDKDGDGKPSDGKDGGKPGGKKSPSSKGDKQSGDSSEAGQGQGSEIKPSGQGKSQGKSGSGGQSGSQKGDGAAPTGGGSPANGSAGGGNTGDAEANPEDANLEYNRQAAELVLQRLKDDLNQDNVDPKLLEELGWTPEQLQRFVDRLAKQLEKPAEELSPQEEARRNQFEAMLKTLDLKGTGAKRAGDKSAQREVEQSGGRRSPVPNDYKAAYEAFTKTLSKQKTPAKAPPGK